MAQDSKAGDQRWDRRWAEAVDALTVAVLGDEADLGAALVAVADAAEEHASRVSDLAKRARAGDLHAVAAAIELVDLLAPTTAVEDVEDDAAER